MHSNINIHKFSRLATVTVAVLTLSSLGAGVRAEVIDLGSTVTSEILWSMARYFTFLTNTLVAVVFSLAAISGRWPRPSLLAALTLWIVAVGAVYHVLLASAHHPTGIAAWSNLGTHTVVPTACLGIWIIAVPKVALRFRDPFIWSLWPLGYAGYVIVRSSFDQAYPYFFLNPELVGVVGVGAYIAGLWLAFVTVGTLFVLATHRIEKAKAENKLTSSPNGYRNALI
ncbi:Pr6Pr family membrane protein [Pseudohalocynthiibacter aestuariivivens]|jgi:hypothetical protein|uniref:Pr6Pr family membrane protein n=1 Tax=Pseudohalocynthiibacter aestuariivivens TaxID=1591409 RepID=A0ABV5JFV2_9RHOB|nr:MULTISPECIES: Pr6Pr family membrane protein [Pseudohalocynthiibacter]MBS9717741.1 Pr6Pr family membrane protein [Pseudohalocynthiibacter aestuariivivens]MCK0104470.1 Pr6Pr family membrane protein [Pseudohalocynthiibacter sp. F2068]